MAKKGKRIDNRVASGLAPTPTTPTQPLNTEALQDKREDLGLFKGSPGTTGKEVEARKEQQDFEKTIAALQLGVSPKSLGVESKQNILAPPEAKPQVPQPQAPAAVAPETAPAQEAQPERPGAIDRFKANVKRDFGGEAIKESVENAPAVAERAALFLPALRFDAALKVSTLLAKSSKFVSALKGVSKGIAGAGVLGGGVKIRSIVNDAKEDLSTSLSGMDGAVDDYKKGLIDHSTAAHTMDILEADIREKQGVARLFSRQPQSFLSGGKDLLRDYNSAVETIPIKKQALEQARLIKEATISQLGVNQQL